MRFTIATAVNNDELLQSCLLASPEIKDRCEILLQRGFASAALAYNDAINRANNDVVILIHQDVYLPSDWFNSLEKSITSLAALDPQWGVLGVYGITSAGEYRGNLYCNANQATLGKPIDGPQQVGTLDEVVLIVRKSSALRFDEALKEFHLYGTDLCLDARKRGMKSYVVPGFCIHNANEYGMFPQSFWRGYLFLRRKFWQELPIRTPCVEIRRSLWPMVKSNLWRFFWIKLKRKQLARRVKNPVELYHRVHQPAASAQGSPG